jgi:type VI secretion system secreted protein Hcp
MVRTRFVGSAAMVAVVVLALALTLTPASGSSSPRVAAATGPSEQVGTVSFDGITGDHGQSTLEVYSFSWGATNPGAHSGGGGGGAGKVNVHDISITRPLDSASPKLLKLALAGAHIKSAVIEIDRNSGNLRYRLTDVLISSFHHGASGQPEDFPLDTVNLAFHKVCMDSLNGNGDPTATTCFDVAATA